VGGDLRLTSSLVRHNAAAEQGGGIASFGAALTLRNVQVAGNAGRYGGGIYVSDLIGFGRLTLADSSVTGNVATVGGGIYNAAQEPNVVTGTSSVTRNRPDDCVGAGC